MCEAFNGGSSGILYIFHVFVSCVIRMDFKFIESEITSQGSVRILGNSMPSRGVQETSELGNFK